jgi:hypothetical protein
MKKTLLLTLAFGLASASPLMAIDVYITGSTAFRQNVYNACKNLFIGNNPTIGYADAAHGSNLKANSTDFTWVMTGTATNTMTAIANQPLTIHALFTGSIQGIQALENNQSLGFCNTILTPNVNGGTTYITNGPTIAFTDVPSAAAPAYDVLNTGGAFNEEQVAVQPFVFVKANAVSGNVHSITNISWEQARYVFNKGRIPFSSWSGNLSDTNNYVYLLNRTLDSGTLVTSEEEVSYLYGAPLPIYNYDHSSLAFYPCALTNELFSTTGLTGFGVIGASAGFNNANLNWGPGYIGGGDIKTALQITDAQNQSISYLSISDAQGITSANWSQVIAFNGTWPTAAGSGIVGIPNNTTNNYAPVTMGSYPFWSYETVVYPVNSVAPGGITISQLGNQTTTGSFLGVLDSQTKFNGGSPIAGSIENEIEQSKTPPYAGNSYGATAIRLSDMTASRATVGGIVSPIPNAN